MKATLFLPIAILFVTAAAAAILPATMANPVVTDSDPSSPPTLLEKRILEQCKNETGVCVTKEACVGDGFEGRPRRID
ncbi:hypothetical protein BGZ97_009635, partial [Linnemannia gamsii]